MWGSHQSRWWRQRSSWSLFVPPHISESYVLQHASNLALEHTFPGQIWSIQMIMLRETGSAFLAIACHVAIEAIGHQVGAVSSKYTSQFGNISKESKRRIFVARMSHTLFPTLLFALEAVKSCVFHLTWQACQHISLSSLAMNLDGDNVVQHETL